MLILLQAATDVLLRTILRVIRKRFLPPIREGLVHVLQLGETLLLLFGLAYTSNPCAQWGAHVSPLCSYPYVDLPSLFLSRIPGTMTGTVCE